MKNFDSRREIAPVYYCTTTQFNGITIFNQPVQLSIDFAASESGVRFCAARHKVVMVCPHTNPGVSYADPWRRVTNHREPAHMWVACCASWMAYYCYPLPDLNLLHFVPSFSFSESVHLWRLSLDLCVSRISCYTRYTTNDQSNTRITLFLTRTNCVVSFHLNSNTMPQSISPAYIPMPKDPTPDSGVRRQPMQRFLYTHNLFPHPQLFRYRVLLLSCLHRFWLSRWSWFIQWSCQWRTFGFRTYGVGGRLKQLDTDLRRWPPPNCFCERKEKSPPIDFCDGFTPSQLSNFLRRTILIYLSSSPWSWRRRDLLSVVESKYVSGCDIVYSQRSACNQVQ